MSENDDFEFQAPPLISRQIAMIMTASTILAEEWKRTEVDDPRARAKAFAGVEECFAALVELVEDLAARMGPAIEAAAISQGRDPAPLVAGTSATMGAFREMLAKEGARAAAFKQALAAARGPVGSA